MSDPVFTYMYIGGNGSVSMRRRKGGEGLFYVCVALEPSLKIRIVSTPNKCPHLQSLSIILTRRLNEKRTKRGLKARSVRGALIGFPNVGKSAIINRLVGRR